MPNSIVPSGSASLDAVENRPLPPIILRSYRAAKDLLRKLDSKKVDPEQVAEVWRESQNGNQFYLRPYFRTLIGRRQNSVRRQREILHLERATRIPVLADQQRNIFHVEEKGTRPEGLEARDIHEHCAYPRQDRQRIPGGFQGRLVASP